jgi:hypothetical protein
MDHAQSIEAEAVERYLLGELSAAEAEEFERHFFECAECAADLDSGLEFVKHARPVLAEPHQGRGEPAIGPEDGKRRRWWQDFMGVRAWMRPASAVPMAAALALGAVALYQGTVVIPGMRQGYGPPVAVPTFALGSVSRGEATKVVAPAGRPVILAMAIPPDQTYPRYRCTVRRADGAGHFSLIVPPAPPGQPVTILVPPREAQPGTYELSVSGIRPDGTETQRIAGYSFEVSSP